MKQNEIRNTVQRFIMASCLGLLIPLSGSFVKAAPGPLPEFTLKGIALHPDDPSYAPTEQLIHPTESADSTRQ